jgi:hypothetical protein
MNKGTILTLNEKFAFSRTVLMCLAMMCVKDVFVFGANKKREGFADEIRPLDADQRGTGQVCLSDHPVPIEAEIGDGGEVIKVDVFLTRFRDLRLGPLSSSFCISSSI